MSCGCKCFVALPRGAVGSYVVCECGIVTSLTVSMVNRAYNHKGENVVIVYAWYFGLYMGIMLDQQCGVK